MCSRIPKLPVFYRSFCFTKGYADFLVEQKLHHFCVLETISSAMWAYMNRNPAFCSQFVNRGAWDYCLRLLETTVQFCTVLPYIYSVSMWVDYICVCMCVYIYTQCAYYVLSMYIFICLYKVCYNFCYMFLCLQTNLSDLNNWITYVQHVAFKKDEKFRSDTWKETCQI